MRFCALRHFVTSFVSVFSLLFAVCISSSASTFKVLYTFGQSGSNDGLSAEGGLISDASGNLYGVTLAGGTYQKGTVFEFSRNSDGSWKETILYNFTGEGDGYGPAVLLTIDGKGNLYGSTAFGGTVDSVCPNGCGVVFELSPAATGWSFEVLHSFNGYDGTDPSAVVLDAEGNVYGTTGAGGDMTACSGFGCGVVFKLLYQSNWQDQTLYTFTDTPDGNQPDGVAFDGQGNLYGATQYGGANGVGMVFELSPNPQGAWTENILYNFCSVANCLDGSYPNGTTVLQNGGIWGTTSTGGENNDGTVFRLYDTAKGWRPREFSFDNTNGKYPEAPVTLASGVVYGSTYGGGIMGGNCPLSFQGSGVVYELSQETGAFTQTVLHTFQGGHDGCLPNPGLVEDSTGNLFGTTFLGGGIGGVFFGVHP